MRLLAGTRVRTRTCFEGAGHSVNLAELVEGFEKCVDQFDDLDPRGQRDEVGCCFARRDMIKGALRQVNAVPRHHSECIVRLEGVEEIDRQFSIAKGHLDPRFIGVGEPKVGEAFALSLNQPGEHFAKNIGGSWVGVGSTADRLAAFNPTSNGQGYFGDGSSETK